MRLLPNPSRSAGVISFSEVLFLFTLVLFLVVVCLWPILTWRLHHFSTWTADAAHSYAVRDHSRAVYVAPSFGRFYISLPWLWCTLLAATVLTGLLISRKPHPEKKDPGGEQRNP